MSCTSHWCKLIEFTILYYATLYYTILYYTILYYTILHNTILYYTILYYTILYYTILYYTVLYCTVLYCTVLYCTVLYCAVLFFLFTHDYSSSAPCTIWSTLKTWIRTFKGPSLWYNLTAITPYRPVYPQIKLKPGSMVKLAPKGHVTAKMVSNSVYQLKQDVVESGPSTAADTVCPV